MSDPPDLTTDRIATLAAELRAAIGKLSRRLREQAHLNDLTWSQISVLYRLELDGPATVTTLARAEGMRQQSMGANISALETAGLVVGRPDPDDGRQTILSLTPSCIEWINANRAARQDWLHNTIQNRLATAEQDELSRAVELLKRLVA